MFTHGRAADMHVPRKRFGQHFLHDPSVINRIVGAIDPKPGQPIVEIGPGLGAITFPLLERVSELHAIEIDRDAIRHLRERTSSTSRLHIHEGDVLEFDLATLRSDGRKLRVVGNLPYNISTPLLFKLIEQRQHIADLHVMLQKEVVARMAAAPNSEHYGRLSVMLAPWLRVEQLFDIGAGAFRPPPRVTSTFARLVPHEAPPVSIEHPRQYAAIVAAAFSQRRKTLRNALKSLLSESEITQSGIDPSLRAETIAPIGYAALAASLAHKKP
jgi:16S rRNA (adenine1518-N6/adenine1519-N6)-dimethyltransferase